MTGASTSDSTCATNLLATYTYDDYSRRKTLTYAGSANASMSYNYTNAGDLLSLAIDMVGTGNDNTWTLQYTPAHQLSSEAPSNTAAYLWQKPTCPSSCTDTYTAVNVLNQYPKVQPAGSSIPVLQSWDADGNLQKDGTFLWGYDQENRLLSACKPVNCTSPTVNAAYAYDPLGRRSEKSGTGVTATVFLQDGSDEIAEYDTSGNLQRRFVPGPAINEPIAMVPASGTTEFVYTDHHGSVVATSDSSGTLVEGPFVYDPAGNCYTGSGHTTACASAGGIPFCFTGQFLDFETGCSYYRARMMCSDSTHGMRFLQTDPVGYSDDLDLYTYVYNDPLNRLDPNGDSILGDLLKWAVKHEMKVALQRAIKAAKAAAKRQAWAMEKKLVEKTGSGSRAWTEAEKKELLETGKVEGYEAHHINSVADNPDLAGNPDNISFERGRGGHLEKHQRIAGREIDSPNLWGRGKCIWRPGISGGRLIHCRS